MSEYFRLTGRKTEEYDFDFEVDNNVKIVAFCSACGVLYSSQVADSVTAKVAAIAAAGHELAFTVGGHHCGVLELKK